MKRATLPYGARSEEELARNQASLGEAWDDIPRTWDERLGFVPRPVPVLFVVGVVGSALVGIGMLVVFLRAVGVS